MIHYFISNRVGLIGFHLGGCMIWFFVVYILSGIHSYIALKNLEWDKSIAEWLLYILLPIFNTISTLLLANEIHETHKNETKQITPPQILSEFDYLISLVDDDNKITQNMEHRCDNRYENFNDIELGFTAHDEIKEMLELIYDDSLTVDENHNRLTKLLSVTLLDDNYSENYLIDGIDKMKTKVMGVVKHKESETKESHGLNLPSIKLLEGLYVEPKESVIDGKFISKDSHDVNEYMNAWDNPDYVITPYIPKPKIVELDNLIKDVKYYVIVNAYGKIKIPNGVYKSKYEYNSGDGFWYDFGGTTISKYDLENDDKKHYITDDTKSVLPIIKQKCNKEYKTNKIEFCYLNVDEINSIMGSEIKL